MDPWKTLSRTTILEHGPFLTVEDHTVELPDGRIIPKWPWVITPDYVNVMAVTERGEYLCFRQVKYGVDGVTLAPVGGYIEPNEAPLDAAKRELLEETGYEAPDWTDLGSFRVGANRGFATAYLYLAREARSVTAPHADDLEEQELLLLGRHELEAALDSGAFKVLAWATSVALALRHTSVRESNPSTQ
ncbi:MAG: NUDIX hydrolase [Candidatus Latescibacterota bacterium]